MPDICRLCGKNTHSGQPGDQESTDLPEPAGMKPLLLSKARMLKDKKHP
jgi:hypothetical protein